MRIYVDEDTASDQLIAHLRSAGHDVLEPLRGTSDARCWHHALEERAVVLTTNARDFVALAATGAHHGLQLVYRENDPTRDMTARAMPRRSTALRRPIPAGSPIRSSRSTGFAGDARSKRRAPGLKGDERLAAQLPRDPLGLSVDESRLRRSQF